MKFFKAWLVTGRVAALTKFLCTFSLTPHKHCGVSTLLYSLQNWKTMVLTFTDLMWAKKPSTLYFHVRSKNEQTGPRYDYLFLKPFSYTWSAALFTLSMPLKGKCWSNVYPKDKRSEKAQLRTPVGGRRQRKHPGPGEGRKKLLQAFPLRACRWAEPAVMLNHCLQFFRNIIYWEK